MPVFNPFDTDSMPEPPSLDGEPVNNSPSAGKNSAAEQGLEIPMGWKPTRDEPVPVVRCKATSTTSGERCKRWSIRGATVCASHGGRLPNVVEHSAAVVEAARMDLMGLAGDAVEVIRNFLLEPGTTEAVRLKAAENVLNRTGIKEALEMRIEVDNKVSPSEAIFESLQTMRERVEKQRAEEVEAELEFEEVIDADENDSQTEPIATPENS